MLPFDSESGRGFGSVFHHHISNPTGHTVGFFLPKPACSLVFPRVLADFPFLVNDQNLANSALSWPIVSAAESTKNDPKSAKATVHLHKTQ